MRGEGEGDFGAPLGFDLGLGHGRDRGAGRTRPSGEYINFKVVPNTIGWLRPAYPPRLLGASP